MAKEIKFYVTAYDTDYGYDRTWDFPTRETAEEWANALLFDFGAECQAHVWTMDDYGKGVAK